MNREQHLIEALKRIYWLLSGEPSEENVTEAQAISSEAIERFSSLPEPGENAKIKQKDLKNSYLAITR